MPLRVNNIKMCIVSRFADRYLLQSLVNRISGSEDGTLRRSVSVIEQIISWWNECSQFLTTNGEMLQLVVLNASSKLVTHLSGHERMGDVVLLKVFVQCYEV